MMDPEIVKQQTEHYEKLREKEIRQERKKRLSYLKKKQLEDTDETLNK